MEQIILFIYSKKGEIRALTSEEAKHLNDFLLKDGWEHISTMDAKRWIEFHYNKLSIKKYEDSCNELVEEFCEKQDMSFEGWVGDHIGQIALCSDFYFNMTDIVLDLKKNAAVGLIVDWYYDNVEHEKVINYNSYIMGLRHKDIDNTKK